MKKYEVISIEPTDLAKHWVITYKRADGRIEQESVEAFDSNEAFIAFRNRMIKEAKLKVVLKNPK